MKEFLAGLATGALAGGGAVLWFTARAKAKAVAEAIAGEVAKARAIAANAEAEARKL